MRSSLHFGFYSEHFIFMPQLRFMLDSFCNKKTYADNQKKTTLPEIDECFAARNFVWDQDYGFCILDRNSRKLNINFENTYMISVPCCPALVERNQYLNGAGRPRRSRTPHWKESMHPWLRTGPCGDSWLTLLLIVVRCSLMQEK